ncbi:MAG: PAS domain-containing protein, partial [Candidatus Obscuribacterales bacterium]|nr:PAS domain-containing protein [Steroidobacteraceae bacterium]
MTERLPSSASTRALRVLGSLRTSHAFVWLLLAVLLSAAAYLWTLRDRTEDMAIHAATREVQALLAGLQLSLASQQPIDVWPHTRIRVIDNLNAATNDGRDEFEREAIAQLRANPNQVIDQPWPASRPTHLRYAAVLPGGRVFIANHDLTPTAQQLSRHLARSYLATGALVFLSMGCFLWLFLAARHDLARLQERSGAVRAEALREVFLNYPLVGRRNRLPWIVAGTLGVFAIDLWLPIAPLSGAAYVIAVMLSLSSSKTWHTIAIAVWTLVLMFVAPMWTLPSRDLWSSFSSHALVTFFIAGAAGFGLALQRRARTESVALSHAQSSQIESEQLRSALSRAEAADSNMRTALDRLTLATRYAGISVWEWDLVADMIYASEGSDFGARLGSSTHLRAGDFIGNYVYADDRDAFAAAFRPDLIDAQSDGQITHRYRSLSPDGSVQHIQLRARVYRDATGKPTRIVGVDWNITREVEAARDLQRQTEQLRDAERHLERASLSSLEGHWETDLLTGQSWVSSSFRALMGFAPGEFEQLNISAVELAHEEDRARQEQAYLAHLEHQQPYDLSLRLRNAHGIYRWFSLQGAAERDASGRPIRISGSIQDIDRQKQAEDTLRDVQARFERAVNGAQDGLFDLDLVNDTTWHSPRYKAMLGYLEHEHEIRVSELPQHMHPDDVRVAHKAFVD